MLDIRKTATGICFKIHVQPKASKNAVAGLYDDALKIRLTAPPVDGAANKMCIAFLSKITGISKSAISIVAGQTSRNKQIGIQCGETDQTRETVMEIINNLIPAKTS